MKKIKLLLSLLLFKTIVIVPVLGQKEWPVSNGLSELCEQSAYRQVFYSALEETFPLYSRQLYTILTDKYLVDRQNPVWIILARTLQDASEKMKFFSKRCSITGDELGYETAYVEAYNRTLQEIFRDYYQHLINVGRQAPISNQVSILANQDCLRLIGQLVAIRRPCSRSDLARFSGILFDLNTALIDNLGAALVASGKLYQSDIGLAQERYLEIHPQLSLLLLSKYKEILETRNVYRRPNYFPFPAYRSTKILLTLLRASAPVVADVTFTYASSSRTYTAKNGLELFGGMLTYLQDKMLPVWEKHLLDAALALDYQINTPRLERYARWVFKSMVLESRQDSFWVQGIPIRMDLEYTAKVDMIVFWKIQVGLDIKAIRFEVDDREKTFHLIIPENPRLIKVILNDYQVTYSDNDIDARCTLMRALTQRGHKTLPHYRLEAAFRRHRGKVGDLSISRNTLKPEAKEIFAPILLKMFEPSVFLFHSCYRVVLHFGDIDEELIPASCPETKGTPLVLNR